MAAAIQLPNGNTAIQLASGDVVDPVYVSLSNLTRMGDGTFDEVMEWVAAERARRAERRAQHEAEMRAFTEATNARLEAEHAEQRERDAKPATMADVRR
jgi:hypothetical protein